MDASEVRFVLRSACKCVGSQRAFAQKYGLSEAFVSDVLLGRREPSDAILEPLNLERVVQYRARATLSAETPNLSSSGADNGRS